MSAEDIIDNGTTIIAESISVNEDLFSPYMYIHMYMSIMNFAGVYIYFAQCA